MFCTSSGGIYFFHWDTTKEDAPKGAHKLHKTLYKGKLHRCFLKDCRTGREKDNFTSQGEPEILPFFRQSHSCCHFHMSYIQQSSTLIPWAKDPLTLEFSANHAFSSSIFVIWRQRSFSSILKTNCNFHISTISDIYFITYM